MRPIAEPGRDDRVLVAAASAVLAALVAVGVALGWPLAAPGRALVPGLVTLAAGAYAAAPILLVGRALAVRALGTRSWLVAWTAGVAALCVLGIALLATGLYSASLWAVLAVLGNVAAVVSFGRRPAA